MSNYPTVRPSLTLDFQKSKQLDPRISFSRSSTATYVEGGVIKYADEHQARFEAEGLLIEESRTNTFLNSNDCSLWSSFRATTGTDTGVITAPDGSNSVGWFENSIGATGSRVRGGTVTASNVPSSLFVWLKARSGSPWVAVGPGQPGTNKQNVFFNLSTGEQGQRGSALVGNVDIVPYPNGWYKIVFTGVTPVNTATSLQFWAADYDGQANEAYTILSSYYCWGAQVEDAASFPTSLIPTSGSTVARSADIAKITGDNFSSWYNGSEGTLTINALNIKEGKYASALSSGTTGSPDTLALYRKDDDEWRVYHTAQITFSSTDSDANFAAGYSVSGSTRTASAAWKGSLISNVPTDASSIPFTVLQIGTGPKGGGISNGHVSRLSYYSRRLTDLELQTITL